MDRKALRILAQNLDSPKCWPHQKGFGRTLMWLTVYELAQSARLGPSARFYHDTRDVQKRERFHPFTPGQHSEYHPPKPG